MSPPPPPSPSPRSPFPLQRVANSRRATLPDPLVGFGGTIFSDHMFCLDYDPERWHSPRIEPYGTIPITPGTASLHYAQTVFDGFKVYRGADGQARAFRPRENFMRLRASCERLCIPPPEVELLVEGLCALVQLDADWIPHQRGCSLYIRPLVIGNEEHIEVRPSRHYRLFLMTTVVGDYFADGLQGISLKVEDRFTRAAPGGLGAAKTGANYAAALYPTQQAQQEGHQHVLWLDGQEHRLIEEVGAMNIMFQIDGRVITPPLSDTILPGVTRRSVLALLEQAQVPWEERPLPIDEILHASENGRLGEIFGVGTAAVICPVRQMAYRDRQIIPAETTPGPLARLLHERLTNIQYGDAPDEHDWNLVIPLPESSD